MKKKLISLLLAVAMVVSMVPAVAVCSLLLSWILNVIYGLAEKAVIKICSKEKKEAPGKEN